MKHFVWPGPLDCLSLGPGVRIASGKPVNATPWRRRVGREPWRLTTQACRGRCARLRLVMRHTSTATVTVRPPWSVVVPWKSSWRLSRYQPDSCLNTKLASEFETKELNELHNFIVPQALETFGPHHSRVQVQFEAWMCKNADHCSSPNWFGKFGPGPGPVVLRTDYSMATDEQSSE